uniref:Uncharacterized protein n=1 Tax=Monopterus albus TaxID=43700 RepID=A0A3Q3J2W9_MONAL
VGVGTCIHPLYVSIEEDWVLTEGEENLRATVKAIKAEVKARASPGPNTVSNKHQPEAVDDFIRNFLFQRGMTKTLDCFQIEWTEMVQKGMVDAQRVGVVPSVYIENEPASPASETLVRVHKARDFHRLQHKRVVQEKTRLIEEMRKLKVQCNSYEPTVKWMNDKYQAVLRQTMLVALEREKVLGQVTCRSAQHNICGDAGEEAEQSVKGTTHQTRPPTSPGSQESDQGAAPGGLLE